MDLEKNTFFQNFFSFFKNGHFFCPFFKTQLTFQKFFMTERLYEKTNKMLILILLIKLKKLIYIIFSVSMKDIFSYKNYTKLTNIVYKDYFEFDLTHKSFLFIFYK